MIPVPNCSGIFGLWLPLLLWLLFWGSLRNWGLGNLALMIYLWHLRWSAWHLFVSSTIEKKRSRCNLIAYILLFIYWVTLTLIYKPVYSFDWINIDYIGYQKRIWSTDIRRRRGGFQYHYVRLSFTDILPCRGNSWPSIFHRFYCRITCSKTVREDHPVGPGCPTGDRQWYGHHHHFCPMSWTCICDLGSFREISVLGSSSPGVLWIFSRRYARLLFKWEIDQY